MTTATDYSALESRELDALVAERVFEWAKIRHYAGLAMRRVPAYSTTWEGAGLVLEAMRERGWNWTVHAYTSLVPGSPFEVALENGTTPVGPFEWPWADGDSLPRVVCIAALRALEAGA